MDSDASTFSHSAAPVLTHELARSLAVAAGFTEAGLAALPHVNEARDAARFGAWIGQGRAGTMQYLARRDGQEQLVRSRARIPFPWARSAIVCTALYNSAQPRSTDRAPRGTGWIARYAWSSRRDANGRRVPSDYHKVLLKRLKSLDAELHTRWGEFESRAYVDTGPVVERALATAAGLGWTGKNTCLIHPKQGSFAFLGVLLTSIEVEASHLLNAQLPDRCGSCRRCIDACPTGALAAPYQMDATRCISYLTIEHRGPIEAQLMQGMGRQIFGCDICQDVCPWNRKAPIALDSELEPREELVNPLLHALGELDERSFEHTFNGSPVRRARFAGLMRNIAIAMGNSREQSFVPRLRTWLNAPDGGLRSAAAWALSQIGDQEKPAENR